MLRLVIMLFGGIISQRLACWAWSFFRLIAKRAGRFRDPILSMCGPTVIVLMVTTWVVMLTLGGAPITQPGLGTGIQANQGPTPTDFATAFHLAGDAMTTVGAGDLAPNSAFYRLFYTFMSVIST